MRKADGYWSFLPPKAQAAAKKVRCLCGRVCDGFACCPAYVTRDGRRLLLGSHEYHAALGKLSAQGGGHGS